ncbi:MAG: RluA family pseudouridine synthase, partial [Clostridia bacterium]
KPTRAGYFIKINDIVTFSLPEPKALNATPQNIPIDIVYEDDYLAVINKAQGMVVHPAVGSESGTLVNALLYNLKSLSNINGVIRPGIVHRLDKDTSGLLVIAKTNEAHKKLSSAIAMKEAKRFYIALVDGNLKEDSGVINQPIGRCPRDRKKMAVVADGRIAETHFKVLKRYGRYTLVEFELKTGRTHQIRVHAKFIHHPVVGDSIYGGSNEFKLKGQLLHAFKLIFIHPISGQPMEFVADLPEYFKLTLDKMPKTY